MMAQSDMPNEMSESPVFDIGLDRLDEAAEVLTTVFIDYPLDYYILAGHGSRRRRMLTESFRMDCLWKLGMGWPLLGVLVDGKLAAVALVVGSSTSEGGVICYEGSPLTAMRLEEMENQLNHTFGEQTHARILEYYALKEIGKPKQPHLYIESIATLSDYRGKGFGGRLLKYVNRLSEEDPLSTGVGLDTQDPVNLAIYSHFGYHVTGEGDIGPVHTWFLFSPKTGAAK